MGNIIIMKLSLCTTQNLDDKIITLTWSWTKASLLHPLKNTAHTF